MVKNPPANAGKLRDVGSVPGWVDQSLGLVDPLEKEMATHSTQDSCLKNSMDGGVWRATVYRVTKSRT